MDTILILFVILLVGPKINKKLSIKIKPINVIITSHIVVGLIIIFLFFVLYNFLPSQEFIKGKGFPFLSGFLGIITILLGVGLMFKKKRPNIIKYRNLGPSHGWIFFFLTWFFVFISKYGFLFSIYSPKIFNSVVPIPFLGVWIFICGNFLSATTLYLYLRVKFTKYPETYLWFPLVTILYCIYQTTLYSLLLNNGLVKDFNSSYPNYASLIVLGYLPMIVIMFLLAFRDGNLKSGNGAFSG